MCLRAFGWMPVVLRCWLLSGLLGIGAEVPALSRETAGKPSARYPGSDTFHYGAFGNLIQQSGGTPNLYLYRGEQFDPDLDL